MEKIFTERAHLMCPKMNFGIVISTGRVFEKERIAGAFRILAQVHPFLRAVLGSNEKDGEFFYDVTDASMIDLALSNDTVTGIDDPKVIREYEKLTGYDWDIRKEGMLKAVCWRCDDTSVFLFVFHHLLADGRGALNLAMEFADLYAENKRRGETHEKLITAQDLPKGSEPSFISRMLIKKANDDWTKEAREPLSYQTYHEYADSFVRKDKTALTIEKTSALELSKMIDACRAHSVTINDYLMARMYREDATDKIIIAKDLRDSLPCYLENALGNYSTAFSIVIKRKHADIWKLAQDVHKKVQKTLSDPRSVYLVLQCYATLKPEVLDAAFMAAKGEFPSKSAAFIGKLFFGFESPKGYSITNLGRIESRHIKSACFIPPASPAIRKTVGVLTVNGEMVSCIQHRNI